MKITRIPTPHSYSEAVAAGDYAFLGLHRGQGETFEQQLRDTFSRLSQTAGKFNLQLSDLVKVHLWLKNISDLPQMEKIFRDYFKEDEFPARMSATTEFIDDDCLLMIDGTLYRGN